MVQMLRTGCGVLALLKEAKILARETVEAPLSIHPVL